MSAGRHSVIVIALIAALAAPAAGVAAPVKPASSCVQAKGVIAKVGGKRTCLKAGAACKPRYQRTYKRNGYTCRSNRRLRKIPQSF